MGLCCKVGCCQARDFPLDSAHGRNPSGRLTLRKAPYKTGLDSNRWLFRRRTGRSPLRDRHATSVAAVAYVTQLDLPRAQFGGRKAAMAKKDTSRKSVKKTPPPRPAKSRVPAKISPEPKTVVVKKSAASAETKLKAVDAELIKVLNRRTELTLEGLIADPVTRHQLWFNPQAEQELWERIDALNVGPLPQSAVRAVFREILSAARAKIRTVRVAYLGPSFSFHTPGRSRTLREVGRSDSRQHDCLGVRRGESRPRRVRHCADRKQHRRPHRRHARHVHPGCRSASAARC